MEKALKEAKEGVVVALEIVENDMIENGSIRYSTISAFLPMRADTCPFCLMDDRDCTLCQYGQEFGICDDEGSAWQMFSDGLSLFMDKNTSKTTKYKKEYSESIDQLIDEINKAETVGQFMAAKLNAIEFLLGLMAGTTKLKKMAVDAYGTKTMC